MEEKRERVGFISGLDFGSEGCRQGLWRLAAEILQREKVGYIVLLGRLVDGRFLQDELQRCKIMAREQAKKRKKDGKSQKELSFTVMFDLVQKTACKLAKNIPRIPNVKLYVITSPAYDKELGERVAEVLRSKRPDILLYRSGGDRLELKKLGKILGAYTAKKNVWMRGDYYDTPVLRVLKDEIKRSTRGLGDFNVVGGFGATVFNPGDSVKDIKRPYLSIPLLNKVSETRTATENQVGLCILDADREDVKESTVITYSFKDLIADEWALVEPPPNSSKTQREIIDHLKQRGPLTIGMLQDHTGYDRKHLELEIKNLARRRASISWPGLYKDEKSNRYYFRLEWFREKLNYSLPRTKIFDDAFLALCCLHAGCKYTNLKYYCDIVPKIILSKGVNICISCGDHIEGLKHDLLLKGEIMGHENRIFNYVLQEKLAAFVFGKIIMPVFEERSRALLRKINKNKPAEIENVVTNALLNVYYVAGNHCEWPLPSGFDALETFRSELLRYLNYHISKILGNVNIPAWRLMEVISSKIVCLKRGELVKLPSGITFDIYHPSMSGTKTPSIRPQQVLQKSEAQIVFSGNFHTHEFVAEWELERGQRCCMQVGTAKTKSGFEESKLKTVDFGVGFLRVRSAGERIFRTECAFYGRRISDEEIERGNREVVKEFDKWLDKSK